MAKRVVFIGGLHRSGTSLLAQCLAQHPDLSSFQNTGVPEDEGQHLQTIFPAARAHGGPGRFAFDPKAHLTENSPLIQPNLAKQLWEQWSRYWDCRKQVLLEKSPPNLIRTRFLQAMMRYAPEPVESSFLIILRHPLAVAMATKKWCSDPVERLIAHWLHAHQTFLADRDHLERVVTLRYEDFICDPDQALDPIWRSLELAPRRVDIQIDGGSNQRYLASWAEKADLLRRKRLIDRFRSNVSGFGYELDIQQE